MSRLRDQHQGAQLAADDIQVDLHVVALNHWSQLGQELLAANGRLNLQAHEEGSGVFRRELLRLGDVSFGSNDGTGDGVHNARLVGANNG